MSHEQNFMPDKTKSPLLSNKYLINRAGASKEIGQNELKYFSQPSMEGINDTREGIDKNTEIGYDKETIYFVITKQFLHVLIKNKEAV